MAKRKPIEIVDLEMDERGAYGPILNIKNVKPLTGKPIYKSVAKVKNSKPIKQAQQDYSDTFLGGIDLGLGFIEKIVPRVERFLKLRG